MESSIMIYMWCYPIIRFSCRNKFLFLFRRLVLQMKYFYVIKKNKGRDIDWKSHFFKNVIRVLRFKSSKIVKSLNNNESFLSSSSMNIGFQLNHANYSVFSIYLFFCSLYYCSLLSLFIRNYLYLDSNS